MRTLLPISALSLALAALAWAGLTRRAPGRVDGPWTRPLHERAADPFPRVIPVPGGGEVRIESEPRHVLAGSVLAAEVLLAICPAERIAAVHEFAADPRFSAAAEAAARIPGRTGGSPEQMLSFGPDLVVTDPYTKAETQYLMERTGAVVVRMQPFSDVEQVQDNLRMAGYLLGLDERAEALVETMTARIAAAAEGRAERYPWRVLYLDGGSYTFGADSTVDDLLARIGARNVAADHGVGPYARLQVEQVLTWRPEVLMVPALPGTEEVERQRIRQDPALRVLECVKRDRILFAPGALLASTSHHLAEAAERIAAALDAWGRP